MAKNNKDTNGSGAELVGALGKVVDKLVHKSMGSVVQEAMGSVVDLIIKEREDINKRIDILSENTQAQFAVLRKDMSDMQKDMSDMQKDMSDVRKDVDQIKKDVSRLVNGR